MPPSNRILARAAQLRTWRVAPPRHSPDLRPMSQRPSSLQALFAEMKRRRVFRVMAVYGVEQTPEGLKRTEDAAPGEIEAIVAAPMRQRLPSGLLAVVGVALLVGGSL